MDLDSGIFSTVLGPLAAFHDETELLTILPNPEPTDIAWTESLLNPRNRIDSLVARERASWRIDGVDVRGQRFFAVHTSAVGAPPLRIDVYAPPPEDYPESLRQILQPGAALRTRGGESANRLPVTQYLLRVLERWSTTTDGFEQQYASAPFGSQIVVGSVAASLEHVDVHLIPSYDAEQCMETPEALRKLWRLPGELWPEVIDLRELELRRQIHESITVVTIPRRTGHREVVFKSLTWDQKHIYNELKVLLTLPPHDNVISRPLYVVTKKCRFGGKDGVCGFILEYYPSGSLQDHLARAASGAAPPISIEQCFKWSRQITRALMHINTIPFGFYPDLKPDNMVLEEDHDSSLKIVLLDLEQRGGWFSWSPPEVLYVEYLEYLPDHIKNSRIRNEILGVLDTYMPGWKRSTPTERYRCVEGGFSRPWLALARERHAGGAGSQRLENAQVFLLGKILWCIFEAQPLVRCGIDHDVLQEDLTCCDKATWLAFPDFSRTPERVRTLIRRCTLGAPEWDQQRRREIVLRGGRLEPASWDRRAAEATAGSPTVEDTLDAARRWWTAELQAARRFMEDLLTDRIDGPDECGPRCEILREAGSRPCFEEVLRELEDIQRYEGGLGGKP